jgi:hypothetical protein
VVATYAECHPDKPVTIGRPLPEYVALVLDEDLEPGRPGEPGELVLGGPGLARGYLGNSQLTNEKFISRSFDGASVERFYRTGDRVRWTPARELEFLGRIDNQIKIRGFRVELSEIESVLLQHSDVKAAAVTSRETIAQVQQLAAFVVPKAGTALDVSGLRKHLASQLPPYMMPGSIEMLAELPRLPSGKVDRNALPAVTEVSARVKDESNAQCTPLEREILGAWLGLFSITRISKTDDFFVDLGGHSLLAARMVSELRGSPSFAGLSMADIYHFPTVASLACELENRRRLHAGLETTTESGEQPLADRLRGQNQNGRLSWNQDDASKMQTDDSSGNSLPTPFWRHFWCGAAQLLSLIFILSFFALQWLAPYLTYTILVEEEYDFVISVLGAFASLVLVYPLMLFLVIALKWLIIGRYKPGIYPLWGFYFFRFWLVTAIEAPFQ